MTMQVAVASSTPNSPRLTMAAALSIRLDRVNEAVLFSLASQAFKDGVVKMGVAFAVFLTETLEGKCFLSDEAIERALGDIDVHCSHLEDAFPPINEGVN